MTTNAAGAGPAGETSFAIAQRNYEKRKEELRQAARNYGNAKSLRMDLEHKKPGVKHEACLRLMETQAPGSTEAKPKKHSYSSAEEIAETDALYAAHLARIREAVVLEEVKDGEFEAAKQELRVAAAWVDAECQAIAAKSLAVARAG